MRLKSFESTPIRLAKPHKTPLIFDVPVTYNRGVRHWIRYFQGRGHKWFRRWLERSHRYIPMIQKTLSSRGLPKDLAYVAMIESGFSATAVSSVSAVGPWQFMRATGEQYGLRSNWWQDERRDFEKSTRAAADYLSYLHTLFKSWYLAAAAYNMGENRLKRLIKRYQTKNFWRLSQQRRFATETKDYVPKLIAAILISKAPALYGFRNLHPHAPLKYDIQKISGRVDLINLADHLGVTHKYLKDLNPELIQGFVPHFVRAYALRIPRGAGKDVQHFIQLSQGIDLAAKKVH